MCFSPEVSFASAIVIGLISFYGLSLVKSRRALPLACLPLVFALHQAFEGVLWLYLRDHAVSASVALAAQRGYMFLAYLFFPVYCPYIAWQWEESAPRRAGIALLLLVGIGVACAHAYLLDMNSIVPHRAGSSIEYPFWRETGIPYVCAVTFPFFLCRDRKMWVMGAMILISLFFALSAYYWAMASVWCFCAAWISLFSVWILMRIRNLGGEKEEEEEVGKTQKK